MWLKSTTPLVGAECFLVFQVKRGDEKGNEPVDTSGARFVATRPKELYRSSAERQRGITNPQRASAWVLAHNVHTLVTADC